MTARRAKIAAALAARGISGDWATEDEAAFLSGVSTGTFKAKVKEWEKAGFPQIDPRNKKRSIPGIRAFWGLPQQYSGVAAVMAPASNEDEEDGQEHWPGHTAKREAS